MAISEGRNHPNCSTTNIMEAGILHLEECAIFTPPGQDCNCGATPAVHKKLDGWKKALEGGVVHVGSGAYIDLLPEVAMQDVAEVTEKDKHYGGSWKKRGGVGAFMMAARKWDRIEQILGKDFNYDIFAAIETDRRDEGILDDIRDLRRYLMLIEAEMKAKGVVK